MGKNELRHGAHTTWRCQYHLVFAPKFRRKAIYGELRADIGKILRNLSVSQFMGFLKGKSTLMIFDHHANLKYKYGSRHFWCRGYYVDTVGKNKKVIEEYIRNQLSEDEMMDQITMKEYIDPFTGSKNKKA